MSQTYGIAAPETPRDEPEQPPARWLVLIDSAGQRSALLFLEDRTQVAEFAASSEEVVHLIDGVAAAGDASGAEWDAAFAGSSADDRAGAEVYPLGD